MASHSLGKVLTVREILPETSKGADGVAWRESTGFGRPQVCNVRVKKGSPASMEGAEKKPSLIYPQRTYKVNRRKPAGQKKRS